MSDGIFLKKTNLNCNKFFETIGSTMTMSATGFDTATIYTKRINNDNKSISSIAGSFTLGEKMPNRDEMYLTEIIASDQKRMGVVELKYEGFLDRNVTAKSPVHQISAVNQTAPIELHPNYSQSKFSWGTVFGEGDSPNEFGRILDEAGAFVKFGPLPDGKDGREGYYGKCTSKSNGPHCKLMGVTDFLALGQIRYIYKVLTKNEYTAGSRNTGKIITPIGGKPPKLPDFRGSKSNWLLTSYNSNKITIGEQSNFGTFFENEFEFLSSLGGWNRLIYEDGSAVHLPRGSSSNW